MKRFISVLLAALLVLCILSGCGGEKADAPEEESAAPAGGEAAGESGDEAPAGEAEDAGPAVPYLEDAPAVSPGDVIADNEHATVSLSGYEYSMSRNFIYLDYENHDDFPHRVAFRFLCVNGLMSFTNSVPVVEPGEKRELEIMIANTYYELDRDSIPPVSGIFAEFEIENRDRPFDPPLITDSFIFRPEGQESTVYYDRQPGEKDQLICDGPEFGITAYEMTSGSAYGLTVGLFAENRCSEIRIAEAEDIRVNGTGFDNMLYIDTAPGSCAYSSLCISRDAMEEAGIAAGDVTEISGAFLIKDAEHQTVSRVPFKYVP